MKEEQRKSRKKTPQTGPNRQIMGPSLTELDLEIRKDIPKRRTKRKKRSLFPILLLFIVLIIIFVALHVMVPKINLIGDNILELSYKDSYQELGATAKFLNQDLTDKIKINNNIKEEKVGNYEVTYTVKTNFYTVKKKRNVKVVDKEKPTIELKGKEEENVCPNQEFEELGYTATDEYDGDLTDKVIIKKGKDNITYQVKDSSNNETTITRKINYVDTEKPEITLKGTTTMYLNLEEEYKEPGYTVTDNCSKDLTTKVTTKGSVKKGVKGTYTITYQVKDDANNQVTTERKVIVSEKTDPDSGEIKKGAIYLTFDDGPSNITTATILDILKEEKVKATFFVTNNGSDSLIKRIYDEGHTIALHTASHDYTKLYKSVDAYFADLKLVSDRVTRVTGYTSKIIRFPGGSSNTISKKYSIGIMSKLTEEVLNRGYRYYDWNIDSSDAYKAKTKEAVYKNVTSALSKNKANFVLMHDIKTWTRDAIRDIIHYGKENGYTFEKIDMDTHMIRQRVYN